MARLLSNRSGRLMLEKIALPEFVSTNSNEYIGYSKLLQDVPGYNLPIDSAMVANK